MSMPVGLAKLERATQLLSEARTVDDATKVASIAAAAEMWARKAKLGLDAQNYAAEIKIRAERKAGELLAQLERGKPPAGPGRGNKTTSDVGHSLSEYASALADADATRQDASRWQQVAAIPAEKFETILSTAKDDKRELSTAGLLRAATSGSPPALQQSDSNEWYTPADYVEAARELMGAIDLDPASCEQANRVVKAVRFYSQADDGFSQEWAGRVWLNPPYGRADDNESNQSRWSAKLRAEYAAGRVTQAVLLINAVTDRAWFQPLWAHSICFVASRIRFYSPEGTGASPTHGSALVYFGQNESGFVKLFSGFGRCVVPRNGQGESIHNNGDSTCRS